MDWGWGWGRRQNKLFGLSNIALLYQNQIDCERNSTSKMKQHNYRTVTNQKILQNQAAKSEIKTTHENHERHLIQELKPFNNETQFLFKKQDRTSRGRTKDCSGERRPQNQGIHPRQNGESGPTHKKCEMFSEKLSSSERLTVKQQYDQIRPIQKGKRQYKHQKQPLATVDFPSEPTPHLIQKQIQKKNKKQIKQSKRAEKEKQKNSRFVPENDCSDSRMKEEQRNQVTNQLLQIFKQKYGYYLIDNKIVFPIEDHLFSQYRELQEETTGGRIALEKLITPLSNNFSKELQIWNMIIEHAAFFEIEDEISIADVASMLSDTNSLPYKKLFKNLHKFYINDVIFQKYDESSNEDYFSFISLWRYSEENGFLDKLFHTSWNKFILFYISFQKHYTNPLILSQLQIFEEILKLELEKGLFSPPKEYSDLLDYLIFLVNMCFETHTFKSLINNKMNFFRDNNKMKNELLQQKKNVENKLWELKQGEKQVIKKQKTNLKQLKKQQKQHVIEKIQELQKENQDIYEQKTKINSQREKYQQKIIEIDNKIYELCCLPEFSNVWLLGEDRDRNLYWFIREQESEIYRECRATGSWSMIQSENIELFHQQLNLRGIKEHKLYEKILYYRQLGYIKTQKDDIELETSKSHHENQSVSCPCNSQSQFSQHSKYAYDISEFDKFSYMQFSQITPYIVKLMILKSQWMMSKYLYERNSKWTTEQNRQEYINKITNHDLLHFESLTQELRTFNEKICVVEINIKITNENEAVESKTRKIQTKIWGINEKYKHFWYDYSRKCKNLSDLHFLVSVLYLTIEKYVTKTRKPNNTKYFFKTMQFGENNEMHECHQHFGDEDLL